MTAEERKAEYQKMVDLFNNKRALFNYKKQSTLVTPNSKVYDAK